MATYTAEPDTYAGWSTGRNFGYVGIASGTIAFASWAYLHGHMRGMGTILPSDQLFLWGMQWIGGTLCVMMAIAVMGSIQLSAKSRGTVTVDDVGVLRQIGRRRWILRWEEMEGFIGMPGGGIRLIPNSSSQQIEIPRFLDDYRGCIAEIKARGLRSLPSGKLKKMFLGRPLTWKDQLRFYAAILAFTIALGPGPLALRIGGLCAWVALFCIGVKNYDDLIQRPSQLLITAFVLVGVVSLLVYRMAHTW